MIRLHLRNGGFSRWFAREGESAQASINFLEDGAEGCVHSEGYSAEKWVTFPLTYVWQTKNRCKGMLSLV